MGEARTYRLRATAETVHLGGFSCELSAALEVESGDVVDVETFSGFYVVAEAPEALRAPGLVAIRRELPAVRKAGPGPHLLTGPIAVRGARPGDALEVEFLSIEPSLPMGWNTIRSGWGVLPERFDEPKLRFVPIDRERGTCEPAPGVRVPVEPFFGILGVAPKGEAVSSIPPGAFGGNLDCRELRAGAKLYLPVQVDGAMFAIGDGHAAQGDGEVNVTVVECSMNGSVRLTVREDVRCDWPFALTPTHVVSMGLGDTLDRALRRGGGADDRTAGSAVRRGRGGCVRAVQRGGEFSGDAGSECAGGGGTWDGGAGCVAGEVGALGAEARRGRGAE